MSGAKFDPLLGQLRTTDAGGSGGSGTVTIVSVVTANGISGTVANPTVSPAITLALGAITPTTVNSITLSGASTPTLAVTGTSSISGANTGDSASLPIGGGTITGDLTVSKSAPALYLTDTAQTAPAGRYRIDTSGDLLRFIRSATVLGSFSNAGLLTATTFSGAGTSLTGTAASLTAGTVTTNANLTGPITSSGNATSVASQTGTGTKFVMDTSPTLTGTPAAPTATAGDSTTQLATTAFVQQAVRSVPSKEASKYATTAALATVTYYNGVAGDGVGATLTGVGLGAITLDGNTPIVGDRLLVKNQVSTFQNGIYTVTIVGTAGTVFVITRALDFNQTGDIKTGATTYVTSGATLAATTWDVNSADSPVMGTDAITFIQSAGPGSIIAGTGIGISGVTVAIDTSVTVDKTTTQTLSNKTFVAPVLGAATGTSLSVSGQLTSTVATGTAPLAVTSTTKVTNLNADTVDGFNANSAATASTILPLNATSQFPGSALGTVRLSAIESTDFASGTVLTNTTWVDFKANQNFTVGSSSSIIIIMLDSSANAGGGTIVNTSIVSRVVIDSAGTPIIKNYGGATTQTAGQYVNPFSGGGMILLTGLSAGTHTIKTQIYSSGGSQSMYCRAATIAYEFFTTNVLELGG